LGFDDFLVAYPTCQDAALKAFAELRQRGKTVYAMIDSLDTADRLAKGLSGCSQPLPVLIDYDASLRFLGGRLHFGVRRSPIRSPSQAITVIEGILRHPELEFAGVMAYEAQVAGLTDRNPFHRFLNPVAGWIRRASVTSIAQRRAELAAALRARKVATRIFNGGGSGSLDTTSSEDDLTEVTAGSALFAPHFLDYYSNIQFEPSLLFALEIVRSSDPGYVTCQGGGYVASGPPGWDKVPRPWLPKGLRLVKDEGCGEVQTPVRTPRGLDLKIGEPVLFRHAKAGELCEHFTEVLLFSNGTLKSQAKTYRGLGKCFF
jgi:D-serine deaminase-like pyridoxal phosphate-dependent protein